MTQATGAPGKFPDVVEIQNPNLPEGFEVTEEMKQNPVMRYFLENYTGDLTTSPSVERYWDTLDEVDFTPNTFKITYRADAVPSIFMIDIISDTSVESDAENAALGKKLEKGSIEYDSFVTNYLRNRILEKYGQSIRVSPNLPSLIGIIFTNANGELKDRQYNGCPEYFLPAHLQNEFKTLKKDIEKVGAVVSGIKEELHKVTALLEHQCLDPRAREVLLSAFQGFSEQVNALLEGNK